MSIRNRNVNLLRRAEIGAERRSRTRAALLKAAFELFGHEHGRATRIEDICGAAEIARGTFYNYFSSIEALLGALSVELTKNFDAAVHCAFEQLQGPAEQTCAAIRYYLRAAMVDPQWGWAMVNTSLGCTLYGVEMSERVLGTLREGIETGDFALPSPEVGRDLLLGTGLAASMNLLGGEQPADYPETVARHILMGLGVAASRAGKLAKRPLPKLAMPPCAEPVILPVPIQLDL